MAQTPWQMSADIYSSPAAFEHAQRVATAFSKSVMVPEHLRKNGMADVLAALGLARAITQWDGPPASKRALLEKLVAAHGGTVLGAGTGLGRKAEILAA